MKNLFYVTEVVAKESDMWKKISRFMQVRGVELMGASTEPDGTVNVNINKHGMYNIGNKIGEDLRVYLGVTKVNINGNVA